MSPPAPAPRSGSVTQLLLVVVVLAALAGGGYYFYSQQVQKAVVPVDESKTLKNYLTAQTQNAELAPGYTDADGDLVADPPADAAKLVNPPLLVFSAVYADDPAKAEAEYKAVMEAVGKATGKPVVFSKPAAPPPAPKDGEEGEPAAPPADGGRSLQEQLDDLKAGKLHVTAFSTGQVPAAVTTAGFVPLAVRADAGSVKYQMEIVVPAGSSIQSPADLRNKTLALVALSSNSGGKAPLVLLKEEFKMLPGRDYRFTVTGAHDRSILETAAGKHDAAAVANDILDRMKATGKLKPDAVRSVYKSASFPRVCFGVSNALDPAVRDAVKKALTEGTGGLKFEPADYKADWQDVREIDRKLGRLLD